MHKKTVRNIYNETQNYYKGKKAPKLLMRGVKKIHSPNSIESWTNSKTVAKKFGKLAILKNENVDVSKIFASPKSFPLLEWENEFMMLK